jgi:hypothetical protein
MLPVPHDDRPGFARAKRHRRCRPARNGRAWPARLDRVMPCRRSSPVSRPIHSRHRSTARRPMPMIGRLHSCVEPAFRLRDGCKSAATFKPVEGPLRRIHRTDRPGSQPSLGVRHEPPRHFVPLQPLPRQHLFLRLPGEPGERVARRCDRLRVQGPLRLRCGGTGLPVRHRASLGLSATRGHSASFCRLCC